MDLYQLNRSGLALSCVYLTREPEINPYICSQLIFNKSAKANPWRKERLFDKWCWIHMQRKKSFNPYLTPYSDIKMGHRLKCNI